MRFLPWNIFAAAVVGNDLHTAEVRGSALGASITAGPVLREALSLPPDEARRTLARVPASASIVLVLPSTLVAVRPTAIPPGRWLAARDEVLRSIETLFPFPASESLVGFISRRTTEKDQSGYIVAADRRLVQPWIDALARALGRPIDSVIPISAAMLGAGFQRTESAEVVAWNGAQWVAHRLNWGEIVELNAPLAEEPPPARVALPAGDQARNPPAPVMSGAELAAAGALATIVAPDHFAPLVGRAARANRRWLPAAATVALGAMLLWGVGPLERWRYDRASARLEALSEARARDVAQVSADRDRVLARVAGLEALRSLTAGPAPGALAAAAAVSAAMPADSFLYRIEADAKAITIKGEARRAGDVLRAIEDRAEFQAARELDTPITVEERGFEMFTIRADRVTAGEKAGGSP